MRDKANSSRSVSNVLSEISETHPMSVRVIFCHRLSNKFLSLYLRRSSYLLLLLLHFRCKDKIFPKQFLKRLACSFAYLLLAKRTHIVCFQISPATKKRNLLARFVFISSLHPLNLFPSFVSSLLSFSLLSDFFFSFFLSFFLSFLIFTFFMFYSFLISHSFLVLFFFHLSLYLYYLPYICTLYVHSLSSYLFSSSISILFLSLPFVDFDTLVHFSN